MDAKPLTPLSGGVIVVVGAKASNFDEDIRDSPRVLLWDSQQQDWFARELPTNCRAVFFTRFVSHAAFGKILGEARKRQITIFNPQGTGQTARQIRELLGIVRQTTPGAQPITKKETNVVTTKVEKSTRTGSTQRIRELVTEDAPKNQFARIIKVMRDEGFTATEASIKTMIGAAVREKFGRKERGQIVQGTTTPKPQAKSEHQSDLLKMLDDVVLNIELIRGEVIRLTELQNKLKEFIK